MLQFLFSVLRFFKRSLSPLNTFCRPQNTAALLLQLMEYQRHPVDDPDYYNCDSGYCVYRLILLVFQFDLKFA